MLHQQLAERLMDGASRIFVQDPGLGLTSVASRFVQAHAQSCAYLACDSGATVSSLLARLHIKSDRIFSHAAHQAAFAFAAAPRLIVIDNAELLGPKTPLLQLVLSIDANSGGERPAIIVLAHDPFPTTGTLSGKNEPGKKGERVCRRLTQRIAPPIAFRYADVLSDVDAIVRAFPSEEPIVTAVRRLCEEGGLDCSFPTLRRAAAFFERNTEVIEAAADDVIRCMAGDIGYLELTSPEKQRRQATASTEKRPARPKSHSRATRIRPRARGRA